MSGAELLMSLEMGLIYGIVAIGIYLSFRVIDFPDLTCDGSFALGCLASAALIKGGVSPWASIILAGIAAGGAGLVTALLNTVFKISALLSGILVAFMLYSINLKVSGGLPNIALFQEATLFTEYSPLIILSFFSLLVVLGLSFLFATDFGLSIRAVGQNRRLATACGTNPSQVTCFTLVLSNGLIGLGGALFCQSMGFADISQGTGTIVIGLAAVMIGEKILPFRSIMISLVACLVGSFLYRFFIALALHSDYLGLKTEDLNLITGLMIIATVFIPMPKWKQSQQSRSVC